ncbi:MAG: hypothetical protein E7256_13185 [Lachnospiraceae bacterium]|nr:hypothetical protein [Lachnospiraceae bacterium]
MSDMQGKVVDLIIGVLIMFIAPVLYFNKTAQSGEELMIRQYTTAFVENVCTHGYLSRTMYEDYVRQLSEQDVILTVEMEHSERIFEPVYARNPGDEGAFFFSGNVREYEKVTYTDEIIGRISEQKGRYEMGAEDSFKVVIHLNEAEGSKVVAAYTGRIRDIQVE